MQFLKTHLLQILKACVVYVKAYIIQILIALDQLLNTVLGGWADETISARCHRKKRWFRHVINCMFWWQKDEKGRRHCELCYWHERERKDMPIDYRCSTAEYQEQKEGD